MSSNKAILAEVRALELTARYVWPLFRLWARRHLAERCAICFASEHHTALVDGICTACRAGTTRTEPIADHERESRELDAILKAHEGAGQQQYDALLLFSGGKDSAYLLHVLQSEYPALRLLAFTVDNNFMSPLAMGNAREIIEKLGADHMVFRPPASFSQKMFRHAFTHLNSSGCAGTVDQFDGDSILDMARNVAAVNSIPLMIVGLSPIQVERHIGIASFESPAERERCKRETVAGINLADVFSEQEMRYWWDGTRWDSERIPRVLFPFHAWGYDESAIKQRVSDLGLLSSRNSSPLLTNNQLVPLMALVDNARYGFSSFEPEFSQLVREGKAERASWRNLFEMAEYSARTGRFIKKPIDEVLTRLGLTRSEVGLATR